MEKVSFKNFLSNLVDEELQDDKDETKKKEKKSKPLPTGILQYLQIATAAED